jgi:dihydropteroate synthase
VLVGTSRKRFLGVLTSVDGQPAAVDDRVEASLATAVAAVEGGARMVRVHDVAPTVLAVRLLHDEVPGVGVAVS